MSDYTISPNMNLIVPDVGVEIGPLWAQDLNNSLSIIDTHNHASGNGVQIGSAGINIDGDLAMNGQNLTLARSLRMSVQGSPLSAPTDLGCLYVSGVDLYYNDENGNQVRMTALGGVAGTPGSIGGLVPPASVTYVPATPAYVFQSDASTSADLDAGSVTIRENVANAKGITISSPISLAADYTLTLPVALPSTTSVLLVDNTGALTTQANVLVPTGVILPYGGSSAPAGYLLCDGSAVSRSTYSVLFGIIGTTYGAGNGTTTFNIPDPRGRAPIGAGTGSGLTNRVLGTSGGDENLQAHDHGANTGGQSSTHNHVFDYDSGSIVSTALSGLTAGATPIVCGASNGSLAGAPVQTTHNASGDHTHPISSSGTGSAQNMMPWIATNYIIKT